MSPIAQLHPARPAAGVLTGRFRRVSRLDDDDAGKRMVAQAVARAKQGDREALRYLYIRYADNVYGYVASIVRDDYEAEDVTQHVFAKLMTALPKYQEREVPFSAWILRVARNVAVDHMRSRRAIPCEEVRELDPTTTTTRTRSRRSLTLRDALATLPEDQREVLVLRHLVGLSPGEIAGRLGRTRAVDPRPASPRPRRPALRADRDGVRCRRPVVSKVAA